MSKNDKKHPVWQPCNACGGTGFVYSPLDKKLVSCPMCGGSRGRWIG